MRIRRGLLFWGLFLIPLGGISLLTRVGTIDPAVFVDAWRLWPLVLVVIGLTLLLGRYRAGLIGVIAWSALAPCWSCPRLGVARATVPRATVRRHDRYLHVTGARRGSITAGTW